MKKVVKITAYVLCLVAVVALTICYLVIPSQTKQAVDIIVGYLNTPVAVAGISTTIGGIVIFVVSKFIISNTKFGKKELEKIKDDVNNAKVSVYEYKGIITDEVKKYKVQFEDLKKESEDKITIMYEEFKDLKVNLMDSLKVIPNKKVQEIVEKYESEFNVREEEIINKTVNTNEYVNSKIKELEDKYQEFLNEAEVMLNEKAEERNDSQTEEE